MTPEVFKDGGNQLLPGLTKILGNVWKSDIIPLDWGVVHYTSVQDRRQVLLGSIIMRRLSGAQEKRTRKNHAGLRPGRGCINHIFTLRQILEHRHTYRRAKTVIFFDLKEELDSVDREVLRQCLVMEYRKSTLH